MRKGRRLPADVLTLASHTTTGKTQPDHTPTSHQDHPTPTPWSSSKPAVNTTKPLNLVGWCLFVCTDDQWEHRLLVVST